MLSTLSIYAFLFLNLMSKSRQASRINDVLFYIHQDISRDLLASELAKRAAYSEQHFHRIFKQVVGESIHQYIRRTRLEYAANQLMFDNAATVMDIAHNAGFNSVSSFSRAFKTLFSLSPGQWRNSEISSRDKPYLSDDEIATSYQRIAHQDPPTAKIIEVPPRHAAYVRHQGYGRSIKNAWSELHSWAINEGRDFSHQFGLHHSNPAVVDLTLCRYVACIAIDKPIKNRGHINQLVIPGGTHAVFHLTGKYGELLPQLSLILEKWLPTSGLKMKATPAYVHYHKNHFIEQDERFELDFYLPVSFY